MYAQSFLVTSVRGIGLLPTTSASVSSGCTGRMKAAFGFRLVAAFFAMSSPSGTPTRLPRWGPRIWHPTAVAALGTPHSAAPQRRHGRFWLLHSMNKFAAKVLAEFQRPPGRRGGGVPEPLGERLPFRIRLRVP